VATPPTTQVAPGIHYLHHPHHRNGVSGKSQWIITQPEETVSFSRSLAEGWLRTTEGWGLHTPQQSPEYLGYARDHSTQVFVAKFVGDDVAGTWHGYPADHQRCPQDIPDEAALQAWIDASLLTPAKLRKVARGQRCNL
jgi:hypothetical protein